ncbi:hypothetical protein DFQ04_0416 [Algoriphagus boseongensis]|uniref:Uncharacterized protein n=1 Tax=Algoriphagus boseongensis TaxID=1442587 RepID=A0A4R6T7G9_9BACT|nr:hypothetical protein [Algoriphagus boseongensis]TDQ18611.1 hypothetical protein DFQ04_0416 [Algoriphagus boseongensis]
MKKNRVQKNNGEQEVTSDKLTTKKITAEEAKLIDAFLENTDLSKYRLTRSPVVQG